MRGQTPLSSSSSMGSVPIYTDIVIIGAGVVGLSVAVAVSKKNRDIIVVEKEKTFGQGASSRNSEVIHAGIYYPKGSLKAKLCVEGRGLLYHFCEEQSIPHKRIGKLIVAADNSEAERLDELLRIGRDNGVDDLRLLDTNGIKEIEPNVNAASAILSPSTGIIDTHQFMKRLEYLAKERDVIFAYGCEVTDIEKKKSGFNISILDADNERLSISSAAVINCAGLYSDRIAEMAGIDVKKCGYRLHYSKGEYFRVRPKKAGAVRHLIYPPPEKESLGIHTVVDMQGGMKLGPNAFYVDEIDYNVDPQHKEDFFESAKRILPFLEPDDLSPDIAGIRAKLQYEGEPERDFVISDEKDKGLGGLINLIGIESPGLTASLAIANYVENMI